MLKLVRSASLTDYLEFARSVGLDPSRMLRSVGLSRRCLQNPDFKVPEDAVRELLEMSAASAGIDDFGLRLAEKRTLANLGPLGYSFAINLLFVRGSKPGFKIESCIPTPCRCELKRAAVVPS
jgi:Arabinose-binding domain of AraC transcription regulator, N-term